MQKGTQSLTLILLTALAACASEPQRPGIPTWDFERDELIIRLLYDAIFVDAIIGRFGGGGYGALIGGVIQDGIDLSPTELNHVISTALAPTTVVSAPMALPLNPTAGDPNVTQWTISESNEGQITTDWRPITGRKAGVLWWEKTYECEARHVITIKQSYRSYRLTNFTVLTEVRERPIANYPWAPADPELGRASFENLKNVLLIAVRAELDKRRAKK